MTPIINISGLSKKFKIHHQQQMAYLSLRDRIGEMFSANRSHEDFWALKEVSFSVLPGESVGIIGRNGAGKSTLLKILSKITPPTSGKIVCRGRIASLLEVGTGFHQELTGRENIFMNGSILGMKKKEIENHFDEIVDFSGTSRFLDTPLKHYSSGMQLRLAFAVAAHLDPEILIIDEVLAVGDAEFQQKCLKKMEDVTSQGRTILFVSHNLGAISKLCSKAILLNQGVLRGEGNVNDIIALYSMAADNNSTVNFSHSIIKSISVSINDTISLAVAYENFNENALHLGFVISDQIGNKVLGSNPRLAEAEIPTRVSSKGIVTIEVKSPKLNSGVYKLSLWAGDGYLDFFHAEDCLTFQVDNMARQKIQADASIVGSVIPEVIWKFNK